MSVIVTVPTHYKYLLKTKVIDEANDVFVIILMNPAFTFNPSTHINLAAVTSSQLATGFGYTQNGKTLSGVSLIENRVNGIASTLWNDVSWTASGGSIGSTGSAIIYNNTVTEKPIVMCIDFGTDCVAPDGFILQVKTIGINITG